MTTTRTPADEELESGTKHRVLALIVEDGPIAARVLAEALALTGAAVRRHLQSLVEAGAIEPYDAMSTESRGRGRPARSFVATDYGRDSFDGVQQSSGYESLALAALDHLAATGGKSAVTEFAEGWIGTQERRFAKRNVDSGELLGRIQALVHALSDDGYAATSRPVHGTRVVQICQGNCPILQVAAAYPELCDAETEGFARMLGVNVQRLATLAGGDHVCTTSITTQSGELDSAPEGTDPSAPTNPTKALALHNEGMK